MSGRSQAPKLPLRRIRSMGLTMLGSLGGAMPPHDDTIPWGPSSVVVQALEAVAHELARLVGDVLLRVQHRRVVELGERVDVELPVAVHVGPVLVHLGHLAERVALETVRRARRGSRAARLVSVASRFTKMNPSQTSTLDRREAVVGLVQVEELVFLLHEGQVAFERVAPAVVLALELPAGPRGLLLRVVLPHQLVPAVTADVVEGAHLAVGARGPPRSTCERRRSPG